MRLTIASATAGFIFPNSNTGEDEAHVTRTVVADQQVFYDAARASHVLPPVIGG